MVYKNAQYKVLHVNIVYNYSYLVDGRISEVYVEINSRRIVILDRRGRGSIFIHGFIGYLEKSFLYMAPN